MPSRSLSLPSLQGADVHLWLPPAPLTACVRAIVSRNTLGHALTEEQRFSHYPVTPMCSISWIIQGDAQRVATGCSAAIESPRTSLDARIIFNGPQTTPTIAYNSGPVHRLMLMLWPDALLALTGLEAKNFVNDFVPFDTAFNAEWQAWCRDVLHAADDMQRVGLIEDFLTPQWQSARPASSWHGHRIQDWTRNVSSRAATSGLGRSLRQAERRVKQWTGQPMRELHTLSRAEQAFFQSIAAHEKSIGPQQIPWAHIADDTGFSDQSHLCRETRRMTGFSPEELRHRIATDECLWMYRAWLNV